MQSVGLQAFMRSRRIPSPIPAEALPMSCFSRMTFAPRDHWDACTAEGSILVHHRHTGPGGRTAPSSSCVARRGTGWSRQRRTFDLPWAQNWEVSLGCANAQSRCIPADADASQLARQASNINHPPPLTAEQPSPAQTAVTAQQLKDRGYRVCLRWVRAAFHQRHAVLQTSQEQQLSHQAACGAPGTPRPPWCVPQGRLPHLAFQAPAVPHTGGVPGLRRPTRAKGEPRARKGFWGASCNPPECAHKAPSGGPPHSPPCVPQYNRGCHRLQKEKEPGGLVFPAVPQGAQARPPPFRFPLLGTWKRSPLAVAQGSA
jgi:hypothetical protein